MLDEFDWRQRETSRGPGATFMTDKSGDRRFVDTNVLVYAHDTSAGEKHARAAPTADDMLCA